MLDPVTTFCKINCLMDLGFDRRHQTQPSNSWCDYKKYSLVLLTYKSNISIPDFSGLVPKVRTPSRMGACIPLAPKTTQQHAWRRSFSIEWWRPDICLMIWPPAVVIGSTIWQDVTWTSDIQTAELARLPETRPLWQIRRPFVPPLTAMSSLGSIRARLTIFPSFVNCKFVAIHLVWY